MKGLIGSLLTRLKPFKNIVLEYYPEESKIIPRRVWSGREKGRLAGNKEEMFREDRASGNLATVYRTGNRGLRR